MSTLMSTLQNFKRHKIKPPDPSGAGALLTGIKSTVLVLVPGIPDLELRWDLIRLLLAVASGKKVSTSIAAGAMISLLACFVESPTALIQRVLDDPDVSIKIVEVIYKNKGSPNQYLTFASRGADLSLQAFDYIEMAKEVSRSGEWVEMFDTPNDVPTTIDDADNLTLAISSVLAQIWIMLAKAVTAPDTAAESEGRRWTKYIQQRRVHPVFKLSKEASDVLRERIATSLSVRRFMVGLILDVKKSPGVRPKVAELLLDVDNYIAEAGIAGFLMAVKYGIEPGYPALALREFAAELSTLEELMVLYQKLGPLAPYMTILDMSVQNKFAPANFPLVWSFAMGVGAQLEKSLGGLNYNRDYLDYSYVRLGQEMVIKSTGTMSKATAQALNMDESDSALLREAIAAAQLRPGDSRKGPRHGGIEFMNPKQQLLGEDEEDQDQSAASQTKQPKAKNPPDNQAPKTSSDKPQSSKSPLDGLDYLKSLTSSAEHNQMITVQTQDQRYNDADLLK
uniref:Nucleocapsid n=1 Tax=Niviventer confucianus morbillivirus TaxID=3049976 RepID=A0A9Y1Z4B8_9MONO|nr:nucleocapsid protein [Niviventer confucianus morbillivirus]